MDLHCGTLIYMAPEVAFSQEYTKCVDVWSCGIIMHEILTGGKHPLFELEEDTIETYKRKLQSISQFETPSEFSWLAKSLFERLTKFSSHQRYSAKEALLHPWITRDNQGSIPERLVDQINKLEYE